MITLHDHIRSGKPTMDKNHTTQAPGAMDIHQTEDLTQLAFSVGVRVAGVKGVNIRPEIFLDELPVKTGVVLSGGKDAILACNILLDQHPCLHITWAYPEMDYDDDYKGEMIWNLKVWKP